MKTYENYSYDILEYVLVANNIVLVTNNIAI
jgi:hypothetical protein